MDTLVKGQSSLYLVKEVTEGTYVAPSVDADGIEPNEDGLEFNLQREEIERNTLTDTIEAVAPRLGLRTTTGSVSVEFKAGSAEGSAPRGDILYESLFGGKRTIATRSTTKTGNTSTILQIEDADIAKYAKGDVIVVLEDGVHEARPISAVDDTSGSANITLAIPLSGTPSDNVLISKAVTYYHDSASPSMSATWFSGGEIREKITGLKSLSAAIENWTANETPSMKFALEGIDIAKDVAAPSVDVDFSGDSQVPVIQGAYAWLGQDPVDYVELGLNIENSKSDLPNAASTSGKAGTRKTAFGVSGTINPYMKTDSVSRWDLFEAGTATSLFAYAYNPAATDGEIEQVVAIWIPNLKITNMPSADQDGVLMDNIEFKAFRDEGNDTMFLSFI